MKILYDCFSCSPYYGSDEGIGWIWPYIMREKHEIWALVRKDRRPDIEKYCSEHSINNIHFIYCDIPDCLNFYYKNLAKRKNGAIDFLLYQFLWQFPAYHAAKKVHKKVHFDIIHHVATNDFRLLGRLYKLDVPLIIGPIGGAQEIPNGLKEYSGGHEKSELFRKLINRIFTAFPGYRKAIRRAYRIYFSNDETLNYLFPKNAPKKCKILSEVGIEEEKCGSHKKTDISDSVRFLWAGRIEYRKGLVLLTDVLRKLPLEKPWTMTICGDGSQKQEIEAIVQKEAYRNRVIFTGKLSYKDMMTQYDSSDVFVFPSLRETTGTVLVEAMSHGLPVICLKQGGGKTLVTEESGILVSVQDKNICIEEFSDAMKSFINNPEKVCSMGNQAIKHVLKQYTWTEKCKYMEHVYLEALNL